MPKVRTLVTRWLFKGDSSKLKTFNRGLSMAKRTADGAGKALLGMAKASKWAVLALAGVGVASVKMAADAEESASKFEAVFKRQTGAMQEWSNSFAKAAKRSKFELRDTAAEFGALLNAMGFADDDVALMSKRLTELTVDLGSFNNEAESEVMAALKSGIIGNMEPVLKYGAILKATNVEQELHAIGINKSNKTATEQEKVLARLSILLKSTTTAQGDAIKTSDSFTNQMKGLTAAGKDLAINLGTALIPHLKDMIKRIEPIVEQTILWMDANKDLVNKGITNAIHAIKDITRDLWSMLSAGGAVVSWLGGLPFLFNLAFGVATVSAIGSVVNAVKALSAAFAIGTAAAGAIVALIGILVALGAYTIANWDDIAEQWKYIWSEMGKAVEDAIGWVADTLAGISKWFDRLPGQIKRGLGSAGDFIMPNTQVALSGAAAGPAGGGSSVSSVSNMATMGPLNQNIYIQGSADAGTIKKVQAAAFKGAERGNRALLEGVKR